MKLSYAGIIIEREDGKFLCQLRDNKKSIPHPNKWSIFGGGSEGNENPKQTIIREIKEEIGINLNPNKTKKIIRIPFKRVYVFYTKLKKIPKIKLREGQRFGFFSRKEIIKNKRFVFSIRTLFRILPLIKN